MPTLPRYDSQRNLTTDTPEPIRTGAAESVRAVSDPLIKAAGQIQEKWQEAQNVMDYTKAKTYMMEKTRENMIAAEQDPDPANKIKYEKQQELINRQSVGMIRDQRYANELRLSFNTATVQNKMKIDGMFRKKELDQYVGNLNQDILQQHEAYLGASDIKARNAIKADAKLQLKKAMEIGAITKVQMQEESQKIDDNWEYLKAVRDASENPQYVLDNLDKYDLDPEDKVKVKAAAKTVADQQAMQFKIDQQTRHSEGKTELNTIMDDKEQTYAEKLTAINQFLAHDRISDAEAKVYEKQLNSKEPDIAISYANDLTEMLLYPETFDKTDKELKKLDRLEYLKSINEYKLRIQEKVADKKLTPQDAKKIIDKIDKQTIDELAFITEKDLKKRDRGFFGMKYGYKDAFKDIKGHLGDEMMSQEALRDYFWSVEGEDMSDAALKEKAIQIANKYKSDFLKDIVEMTSPADATITVGNKRYNKDVVQAFANKNNISLSKAIRILRSRDVGK